MAVIGGRIRQTGRIRMKLWRRTAWRAARARRRELTPCALFAAFTGAGIALSAAASAGSLALTILCVAGMAKLAGGLLSGSTALLAEAAHSLADTTNQAFLLVSIRLSKREPDEAQPFGHGQQRFLWTFMAAVGMFLAGAVFAIGYGAVELVSGAEGSGGFAIAWITLAIALAAESTSWVRLCARRARRRARPESRCSATRARAATRTSR